MTSSRCALNWRTRHNAPQAPIHESRRTGISGKVFVESHNRTM
jgi:hypothetical protein